MTQLDQVNEIYRMYKLFIDGDVKNPEDPFQKMLYEAYVWYLKKEGVLK